MGGKMETRNMKATTKKVAQAPARNVAVEIVSESRAIDALLTQTEAGYLAADAKIQDVPTADLVSFTIEKLKAQQGALRLACLFTGALFKTCGKEKFALYADGLTVNWGGMAKDVLSIGKALPALEAIGLKLTQVSDIYGLREVRKILLGDDKAATKKAVALLNEGRSPRKVKQAVQGEKPEAGNNPKPEAPVPEVDKSAVAETQLLVAAERVASTIDHDARVKLAMQVIAKLKLAGYALQKLKA